MTDRITKIIFLDFDGVLTTWGSSFKLIKEKLDLLGKIIEATDCSLVISSSWREYDILSTIEKLSNDKDFYNNGLKFPFCDRIIGITKKISYNRSKEISEWIKDNQYKGKYVVLDDIDLPEHLPFFLQTNEVDGLTEEHVEKAINILNS